MASSRPALILVPPAKVIMPVPMPAMAVSALVLLAPSLNGRLTDAESENVMRDMLECVEPRLS